MKIKHDMYCLSGTMTGNPMEAFHVKIFWRFLKKLGISSAHAGRKVAVIIENAQYHHTTLHKDYHDKCVDKIQLEFMLSYNTVIQSSGYGN